LILAAAAQKTDKYSAIDHSKATDRRLPSCTNAHTGYSRHWQIVCTEPFNNSLTGNLIESKTALVERLERERELKIAQGGHYLYRAEIEPGMTEIQIQAGMNTTTKDTINQWCSIPGYFPHEKDACQLCESIHENYIVPRGYLRQDGTHMCVCKKWGKGQEQFQACNCDLCDALLIDSGLRAQCKKMHQSRFIQRYLSAYATLDNHNAYLKQYNEENGLGIAPDFLVGELLKDQLVCKSGIQGKISENHDGNLRGDIPRPEKSLC
jgi:hypothetical protein